MSCPNCGYCPHCGRGAHTYPYTPFQPSITYGQTPSVVNTVTSADFIQKFQDLQNKQGAKG